MSAATTSDGRARRAERSRQRIADALYELIGEGETSPSAQAVADRAGVGIRSVFRLFSDMDALYATINERLVADAAHLIRGGPLDGARREERIDALLAERFALYARLGHYVRATHRHRDRSAFLAAEFRKLVRLLRARSRHWLPELADAPSDLVEALDQALSFEAWDRMRVDQRLSRARTQAAMQRVTRALISQLEESP